MNRRAFLGSSLAAPVAACLPDIRRPTLLESLAASSPMAAWMVSKALRLAQSQISEAVAVTRLLAAGDPTAALMVCVQAEQDRLWIMVEAPPWLSGAPPPRRGSTIREAIRLRPPE